MNNDDDSFDQNPGKMEIQYAEPEVGSTYPLYGMITEFVSDVPGQVCVVINFNTKLNLVIEEEEKISLLKERAFEPGIFVTEIIEKNESGYVGNCSTIVFGKRATSEVQ